jgi:hypothetical protein
VPRRGGGVMGHSIGVAHDPSVADYRATSPRCCLYRGHRGQVCGDIDYTILVFFKKHF